MSTLIKNGRIITASDDYEFLPASHALLNQHMRNQLVAPVP